MLLLGMTAPGHGSYPYHADRQGRAVLAMLLLVAMGLVG
jgi:hypothetical protein